MTPETFAVDVLPEVIKAWNVRCLCAHPGFRKLLSFNFQDYDAGPMSLMDAEIIGYHIIGERFTRIGKAEHSLDGEILQRYSCPQCGVACEETYDQFSISMDRSYFAFEADAPATEGGLFLIGIRAFSNEDFLKVHDFRQAATIDEFLNAIGVVR